MSPHLLCTLTSALSAESVPNLRQSFLSYLLLRALLQYEKYACSLQGDPAVTQPLLPAAQVTLELSSTGDRGCALC